MSIVQIVQLTKEPVSFDELKLNWIGSKKSEVYSHESLEEEDEKTKIYL